MKSDNYLKIALIITLIIISLSLFSNLSDEQRIIKPRPAAELEVRSKNADIIKKLIDEGKLSAKEALFYEKIN